LEIQTYIEEKRRLINSALESMILPFKEQSPLYPALSYSLLLPGKRIRPILTLSTYEAITGDDKKAVPFACAIEAIHTYSLIHDDLPIMDNSDMRRGKLTTHKVYGSDMALLAGDALLSLSFDIISSQRFLNEPFDMQTILKIVQEFAASSGIKGLVGGQVMDMVTMNDDNIDKQTILYIESMKTGSLIRLAVRVGGILGGIEDEELNALTKYSENFGISYQIVDDILDMISSPEIIGKEIGQDIKNKKATFPTLFGVEKAREIAQDFVNKAIDFLKPYEGKYKNLEDITIFAFDRAK
jgi:geranylgeranyl diphosphate synthase type II